MNDRLADLHNSIPTWTHEDDRDVEMGEMGNKKNVNVEKGSGWWEDHAKKAEGDPPPSQPDHMKQFFNDVEAIKLDISAIADATKKIITLKDKAILTTSETDEAEISKSMRKIIDTTNGRAKQCKNLIGLLKEENSKLKKEGKASSADLRVRENLANTLLRKFIDEMKRYQNAQQQYTSDLKKKVTRQVQIIKPEATEEEVDQIMRSDGGREVLYQQCILKGGVNDQILTHYQQVAGKYQDVLALEASVAELHQMFLDFALLTDHQGDMLDNAEYHVQKANDYTEEGNEEINRAIEYQKKLRKKQCWIILIAVIILFVFLFAANILP